VFWPLNFGFYKINKNQKVIAELLCILEIFPQKMHILKISRAETQIWYVYTFLSASVISSMQCGSQ
jgi:hypothetical protein